MAEPMQRDELRKIARQWAEAEPETALRTWLAAWYPGGIPLIPPSGPHIEVDLSALRRR